MGVGKVPKQQTHDPPMAASRRHVQGRETIHYREGRREAVGILHLLPLLVLLGGAGPHMEEDATTASARVRTRRQQGKHCSRGTSLTSAMQWRITQTNAGGLILATEAGAQSHDVCLRSPAQGSPHIRSVALAGSHEQRCLLAAALWSAGSRARGGGAGAGAGGNGRSCRRGGWDLGACRTAAWHPPPPDGQRGRRARGGPGAAAPGGAGSFGLNSRGPRHGLRHWPKTDAARGPALVRPSR
mmetsp:Transcript_52326/g.156152  ORF Transcript_52326/g.156152 Transcript_52326/m.156152 type:complete len:242 (-) Transcript_52326:13-738(-)